MTLIDQFKNFCRDKCKYNVDSLDEIKKLYDEFEESKKSSVIDESYDSEVALSEDAFADILNPKSE